MANKRQRITALAYDRKGKLIAIAVNSYTKTHPVQAHYAARSGNPHAIYMHAEIAVLLKARGKGDVHSLVVTRFNSKGIPVNSAPCKACQLAIKDYGVKHVRHT